MSKHNFNRNFAVIIGVNNYQNNIKELITAVPDALKLAEIIQKQHENLKPQYQAQNKYEVQLFLNQRASLNQLKQLIADFKQGQITLDHEKVTVTESDRLLFYFAGHGIALDALENQEGPVGYLIPQDAISGDSSTYLPMQELHDALNALPCRHMLAILDCCFAGAFRWASVKREVVRKVQIYKERYDRFISDRAWQVITSASDDQKALDSLGSRGRVTDGNEVHSPFAQALFDVLLGKGGDLNQDGMVTATELYSYLRDQVEIASENYYQRQTPSLCPLRKHDKGEFIFLLPGFDRNNLEDAPQLNVENNPYRGLESYDEKHSHLFFGRENLIQKLYNKVIANQQPLTLVLGASGTGKSSLMKAGLLPRLRNSQEQKFEILDPMRPGESPLKALAQICLSITKTSLMTAEALAKDEEALANIIESWSKNNPQTKVLLTVDQFEELITLCKSDAEREQFQKLIKNVIAKYPNKIHVVITLRLDFEAQFQTSVLEDFWNDETRFVVPPMSQNEFREAIEKPALEKVVYFDPPSLVDELINEVVQMPGALPLLSFTLSELYLKYLSDRTRDNRAFTKKDYEELGRVVGSLTKRANQEYDYLIQENLAYENTVRQVMLRMISLQGGELARRQVLKSELVYASLEKNERVKTVIERFSQARLIIEDSNSEGEPYVEPAHDALVRSWDKILKWKNENVQDLVLQQSLNAQVSSWKNNGKPKARLWHDDDRLPMLKQLLEDKTTNWLNEKEEEFIKASIELRDRLQEEKKQQKLSTISRLTTSSQQLFNLNQNFDSLLTSINAAKEIKQAGFEIPDDIKYWVKVALQQSVLWRKERNRLEGHKAGVSSVSFSLDGQLLASASFDKTIKLWNTTTGELIQTLNGHKGTVNFVSFSPLGRMLVSASDEERIVKIWDVANRLEIANFPEYGADGNGCNGVCFSPDEKTLAVASQNNKIKLWDIATHQVIATLSGHEQQINSLSFSPDGKLLASGDHCGRIKLWDVATCQVIDTLPGHNHWVFAVNFSPDGQLLASGSEDNTIKLWDVATHQEIPTRMEHQGRVTTLSFSPDGQLLASVGFNPNIKLWDVATHQEIVTLTGHGDRVTGISFHPLEQLLASGSIDNIAIATLIRTLLA